MTIVISKRTHDYHACLEGHPEIWGPGKSPDEAVGNLIRAHGERFKIEIKFETGSQ